MSVKPMGTDVAVSIKDNGTGIPGPMLSRVFEMFRQVGRPLERSQGGLGIGLTIAKQLVEMHGGRIEAKSGGEGQGSEFVVQLPVFGRTEDTVVSSAQEPRSRLASPRRILIVDDNRDAASTLATMLRILGNETQVAHDGFEALDAAATYRPEIVLLDIGMPRLSGYDVCRRLREQPWGNEMVIVAVTGWGKEEDRQNSRAAGFNYHLVKPVEPAALKRVFAEFGSSQPEDE
jgi:CheY-like chemotaxis protein